MSQRTRMASWLSLLMAVSFLGCDGGANSRPDVVWGIHGTRPGWLHKPRAAAFDGKDRLYMADLTDRIQAFDRDGKYLLGWRTPDFNVDGPSGLTVDRYGRLLVSDTHFYRVLVYSLQGELLFQLGDGVQGTTPGRFGYPTDAVIDRAGNFYVGDYGDNDRIQVFSPEGKWLRQWGGMAMLSGSSSSPGRWLSTIRIGSMWLTVATTGSRSSIRWASCFSTGGRVAVPPGR